MPQEPGPRTHWASGPGAGAPPASERGDRASGEVLRGRGKAGSRPQLGRTREVTRQSPLGRRPQRKAGQRPQVSQAGGRQSRKGAPGSGPPTPAARHPVVLLTARSSSCSFHRLPELPRIRPRVCTHLPRNCVAAGQPSTKPQDPRPGKDKALLARCPANPRQRPAQAAGRLPSRRAGPRPRTGRSNCCDPVPGPPCAGRAHAGSAESSPKGRSARRCRGPGEGTRAGGKAAGQRRPRRR